MNPQDLQKIHETYAPKLREGGSVAVVQARRSARREVPREDLPAGVSLVTDRAKEIAESLWAFLGQSPKLVTLQKLPGGA